MLQNVSEWHPLCQCLRSTNLARFDPYGVSFTDTQGKGAIPETTLAAAKYLGARVTRFAIVLSAEAGELWVPKK
jgi:hypothetical protein